MRRSLISIKKTLKCQESLILRDRTEKLQLVIRMALLLKLLVHDFFVLLNDII